MTKKKQELYQMKKSGRLMVVIDEYGYRELTRLNDFRRYKERV